MTAATLASLLVLCKSKHDLPDMKHVEVKGAGTCTYPLSINGLMTHERRQYQIWS